MKIKPLNEFDGFQKQVIALIYKDAKRYTNDSSWRNYENKCTYEGKSYIVKCAFRCDNDYFTYRHLDVSQDMGSFLIGA